MVALPKYSAEQSGQRTEWQEADDTLFRRAAIAYVLALALIGSMSAGTYVLIDTIVKRQEETARVVNIAGRQRMLSQRIAGLALELSLPDAQQREALPPLRNAIDLMEASHNALSRGSREMGVSTDQAAAVADLYFGQPQMLDARVGEYLGLARSYLALPTAQRETSPILQAILAAAREPLLHALDAAVTRYQLDSEAAIRRLRLVLVSMLALMLGTLVAEVVLIFRPLFRRLSNVQGRLAEAARTDSLTGCLNRRHLLRVATQEFDRARRYGSAMALMMIDIDRFKHINDAHGHAVGDEAIIAVVETILSASRGSDALGRFGGDEFVLLLPQTTLEHALVVAEKIRKVIAAAPVELDAGSGFAITVSIGVTQVQPADVSVHDALLRVDEAMYAAKAAGRGCVMARP